MGPRNAVLLAAGSGSRLSPLTDTCHKSLLPINGIPALQMIVQSVLDSGASDVIVVTGHRRQEVESFIEARFRGVVRCVNNERYRDDVNILSVDIGVDALRQPSSGYMIVETDLVIEPSGWRHAFDVGDGRQSYWVTRGRYSSNLTGGAMDVDDANTAREIVYRPHYDAACEGWQKLLGILYVGSQTVEQDRLLRKEAIARTIRQYYMEPWVGNLAALPCSARDLGDLYAISYNDKDAYDSANAAYARIVGRKEQ